jgi:phage shock protein PspC (stress-responsive transcriptional regulator)
MSIWWLVGAAAFLAGALVIFYIVFAYVLPQAAGRAEIAEDQEPDDEP